MARTHERKKALRKKKLAQRSVHGHIKAGHYNKAHGGWEPLKEDPRTVPCMQT